MSNMLPFVNVKASLLLCDKMSIYQCAFVSGVLLVPSKLDVHVAEPARGVPQSEECSRGRVAVHHSDLPIRVGWRGRGWQAVQVHSVQHSVRYLSK